MSAIPRPSNLSESGHDLRPRRSARKRRLVAVAAAAPVAALLLVTAACPDVAATTPAPPAEVQTPAAAKAAAHRLAMSRRVFVVGDSLTVGSASAIRTNLRRRVASVDIDAAISRFTATGVGILHTRRAARAQIWVVALGTNDSADAGRMRSFVHQVMRLARWRKVLWVNVVRPGGYERVNQALAAQQRRYRGLSVLDWYGIIRRHRGWLTGDGVHLTSSGYQARGAMIAGAAARLARMP